MSFAKVYSAQNFFLTAHIVTIEVDLSRGLHSFSLVGLPNKAVEEARDRISAAIKNSGFVSPKQKNQKVVVSLAPADIKKEGPHFDLGIALCYLKAAGEISFDAQNKLFLGELSLDGIIRKIHGTLGLVMQAQQVGFREIYVPKENLHEASLVKNITLYGVGNLKELIDHLQGFDILKKCTYTIKDDKNLQKQIPEIEPDFMDIVGQENAKRVLEIAAAGKHNIMLYGPPGTGKTMLAKAFPSILPPLSYEEIVEATAIHSATGILSEGIVSNPPLRQPHHTSSAGAIIGGGNPLRAGEITLAHKGVLLMDEFPEFDRRVIEAMRQPLEERKITLARTKSAIVFPADFILITTMNPCPCGYFCSKEKLCTCTHASVQNYRTKISGPIIDRIDLWTSVDLQKKNLYKKSDALSEKSETVRARVHQARLLQKQRFGNHPTLNTNGQMINQDIRKYIRLGSDELAVLNAAADQLSISMRSYYRIIKIARTIADLANEKEILENHILEAFQYRPDTDFSV